MSDSSSLLGKGISYLVVGCSSSTGLQEGIQGGRTPVSSRSVDTVIVSRKFSVVLSRRGATIHRAWRILRGSL